MISEALVRLRDAIGAAEIDLANAILTDVARIAVSRGLDEMYLFPNHYCKGGKDRDSFAIDKLAGFYRMYVCDSPAPRKWTPEKGWEIIESGGL